MAPAVARPHIIARNLLTLNSSLPTFTSLSSREPNLASTWVSVLLTAIRNVNRSAPPNRKRLNGVK